MDKRTPLEAWRASLVVELESHYQKRSEPVNEITAARRSRRRCARAAADARAPAITPALHAAIGPASERERRARGVSAAPRRSIRSTG